MAFCSKCGKELGEDWKFCKNCGTAINGSSKENNTIETKDNIVEENNINDVNSKIDENEEIKKDEIKIEEDFEDIEKKISKEEIVIESITEEKNANKNKEDNKPRNNKANKDSFKKIKEYWNKMNLFYKLVTITTILIIILLLSAMNSDKFLPIFITIIQIIGLVVAVLIHKQKIKTNKGWLKYLIIGLTILCSILNIKSYSLKNQVEDTWNDTNSIISKNENVNTPYKANDCIGKQYDVVKNDFKMLGFNNITEEVIYDLEKEDLDKAKCVETVSINGIYDFEANQEFKSNSKVIIKYHTFKKVAVPMSSEILSTTNIEKVIDEFEKAGFINLKIDEKLDLDPDINSVEFKNTIKVNGIESFEKETEFPIDSEIIITIHKPYEKYTVKIDIEFYSNLLFDTYGVDFEFNGETTRLNHGEDKTFEFRVEPGKYKGTFEKIDSSSVKGTFELDVSGDINAAYWIDCYTDYVQVNEKYIENKGKIKENEAMVPDSYYGCIYEDYKDIEEKFKNAGFTNIIMEPIYDIYWGITPEGEVSKVSINGENYFEKGAIFAKDSKVIITYHMKEDDDPARKVEDTKVENVVNEIKQEDATLKENVNEIKQETYNFYTTNDNKIAKNGNTGKFAYYSKGKLYDNYWVIDFDEGYIYNFTDRNNENWCDKIKIKEGNLNDGVKLSYTDKDYAWAQTLHFKYVNQPHQLIIVDNDYIEWEYETVSLKNALELIKTKDVKIR